MGPNSKPGKKQKDDSHHSASTSSEPHEKSNLDQNLLFLKSVPKVRSDQLLLLTPELISA